LRLAAHVPPAETRGPGLPHPSVYSFVTTGDRLFLSYPLLPSTVCRRHIAGGEFHYIGKETSTRWAGDPDPSMLADAGALDPADETCREYESVVDRKCLEQIRTEAKQFSNKLLSRQSGVARCAIMNFRNGRNTSSRAPCEKLTRATHDLQNKSLKLNERAGSIPPPHLDHGRQ